jgi:hypothetical protein
MVAISPAAAAEVELSKGRLTVTDFIAIGRRQKQHDKADFYYLRRVRLLSCQYPFGSGQVLRRERRSRTDGLHRGHFSRCRRD